MMYFVATHINGEDADYENLETAIKALGPWSNRLKNCWLLESKFSASRIRDLLKPHIHFDKGDRLFVAQFSKNWAGTGMGSDFPEWLKRRDFDIPAQRPTH